MALEYGKIFLAGAIVIVAIVASVATYQERTSTNSTHVPTQKISINGVSVLVEMATTPASRQQGLSGRSGLAKGEGMLFVFDRPGEHGFWMKDMHFSLDIIFAAADGSVVSVFSNVSPESYPKSFRPALPALYVLEVPAGFANDHGIAPGSKLVL